MKENQYRSQYITKTKVSKNSIFFSKFPAFIGANSNMKSVKAGSFYIRKENNYLKLKNNLQSNEINKIYSNKKIYVSNL